MTSNAEQNKREPAKRRSRRRPAVLPEMAARRHQGRMLTLQVLYEVDLSGHDPAEVMSRAFAEHDPVPEDVIAHVQTLVRGVLQEQTALDAEIAAAAPARALMEQAAIERNVLRLAAFELRHQPDVPPKVVINEAVELAKRFGGENSGKFVNGVLRTLFEARPAASEGGTLPADGAARS